MDDIHLQARAHEPQEPEQELGVRAGVSDQSAGRRRTGLGTEAVRSTRGQAGVETSAAGAEAAGVRNADQQKRKVDFCGLKLLGRGSH